MKTGKTLQELAIELDRQRTAKKDYLANENAVRLSDNGQLSVSGEWSMPISEIAHNQLASRLDIPVKYYDKLLQNCPSLLRDNVNHWLEKNNGKMLVRTLDNQVRAFLSSKYKTLDNAELAEVALPVLMEANAEVVSCEITEKRLYLQAVTPKVEFEIKQGDVVQAGLVISNSEIGFGSLRVEPLIYRLVCENSLISEDTALRKKHIGIDNYSQEEGFYEFIKDETREAEMQVFWMKIKDLLQGIFSKIGFETIVEKFRKSTGDKIEGNTSSVVEVVTKRYGLSYGEGEGVLENLIRGNDITRYGLINAVTAHAQVVESYDRSIELQRIGGSILELPRSEWSNLSQAVQ